MKFRTSHWRSLKTRVTLFTLAIFVTGIWALAFYASQTLREDMQRLLGEQQFSTASFIAAEVNEQLDNRLRALEQVAGTIRPALLDNTTALQAALEDRPIFQAFFNGGTFATRTDGIVTASIPLSAKRFGVNVMDRDYMVGALKEGKAVIGRPVIGKKLLIPVLLMAAPIRDAQGKVIGALAGVTNLGMPNFLDKITKGKYGKSGTYLLAAPQHNLFVTSSDKSRIMRALPVPGSNPLHDKFAQGYEGYGVLVNFRGEEELAAAKRIPVAGWFLGIALPTTEAFAPIRAMQHRMLWAAIFLTLLAGGLTSWMLRRQLSPMLAAVKMLATLSAGDQPIKPLPIMRQDEIGQLIGGFNRLIETLTQRKEALQASETRFRCLTEMSSDFFWESDVEHRFTHRTESKKGAAGLDLRPSLFIGARRWEIPSISPDEAGWRAHRELLDAQLPFREFEISRIGGNGAMRHVCVSGDPVFDAAGNFKGYRGIGTNITERKRAEIALLRSENNLSRAQAVAQIGSWYLDISTNRLELSAEAFRIFGISKKEAVDLENFFSAVHPDDRDMVRKSWNEAIAGAPYDIEHRVVADGNTRWIRERGAVERDTDGRALFGVGTTQDITERKRAEDLAKAQQTQIKLAAQVFAQGREGIMICDARGNIIMANKAFAEISGYGEAELLGKNMRILSSGRHSPEFYRSMWEAINTRDCWAGEIWDRRKDGTQYPVWLVISAVYDEQGLIMHYVGSFSDLSDAKAAEHRIDWLAHFDTLTGLPNRALLQDRTTHAISMMQRASEPLTMMLLRIDHLKVITDTLGHHAGEALLLEMARRISDSVRDQDTVAQLSGKEFVLLLPGTPAAGAAHLATGLLAKLAQPYQMDGQELTVTASIGLASYPDNGSDFDSLVKAADIAMQRAKANGRDTFEFYTEDMYQQVHARDQMARALRHAAALDQLQLVYQPLVDLQTGQISGMEALLRWHHPELGSVSPAQFIPLAEQSGFIKGIGEWVLRRACRDIRTWLDKGIKVPHVAVNVSPLQFNNPDLVAQVKSALSEHQVDPELIYLEVTEGALMDDVPRSEAMLKELKELGVKLSLDDFGTGYSSLSYLKRFPFDKVKIDQSFVRDVTTSLSDAVLVKVIISMANGLGLKVIAEGVETEAQCEIMRTNGCDEIQGYFFSKPISAQAIEELFTEGRQLPPHLLRLRKPQRTLLLVDDEPNILASLKRLFRRDCHVIHTANSGPEGLDVLSRHKVDIIISDQRMPGMTGVEFLRAAKVTYPDTIRIVLSGYTELQSVTDAINEGAVYRFLTKPWEDELLREHIHKAFEHKELLEENRQLDLKIRSTNQELVATNRKLGEVLQKKHHQIKRDETSLAIVREALQHVDLPIIGVDDEGLMAFVNDAAERLFEREGPLLGMELAYALPAVDTAIASADENVSGELLIDRTNYLVKWNAMGANSQSRGRLVTLTKVEMSS